MKNSYILSLLFLLFSILSAEAQSVSLTQASITPAPLGTLENNGNGIGSILFVESSGTAVPAISSNNPNVSLNIQFQYVKLKNGDVNTITGSVLDYFIPTYDEQSNQLLLEQSNEIPGDWSGIINFPIDVIQNSNQEDSLNGFDATISALDENTNAEGNASIFTYTDESVLFLNEKEIINLTVYPIPTKDILNFRLNTFVVNKVEIYDLFGKRLFANDITDAASEFNLNISELSKGIYLVKIYSNEISYSAKIIKE